jgi:hypothetical protein
MNRVGKGFALFIILIIATYSLSLIMVKPVNAQSTIPRPSVPQFTLKLADHSYDVPPVTTTTTDPYTGEQVTHTTSGYHVKRKTIDLIIQNQFLEISVKNAINSSIYYNMRYKGHYESTWKELSWNEGNSGTLVPQSDFQVTVISIPSTGYPNKAQLDFQVQAFVCAYEQVVDSNHMFPISYIEFAVFADGESGWSSTQTITIGEASTSTLRTPTPTVPEFSLLVVLPLIFGVFSIAVILWHRKPISQNKLNF